jgi:hypothetical protein
VGDPQTTSWKGRCTKPSEDSVGQDDRAPDDNRPGLAHESGDRHGRGDRSWRTNPVEAREIIAEFHLMIRRRTEAGLTLWIERARSSLVASFANGVARDEAAVRTAITSPWSNGQTEGQITRLKLVRRQMYGRGKNDLLQARLIGAE